MSVHEFVFALELSDGARFDAMVTDLAAAILDAVGCGAEPVAALSGVLQKALSKATDGRRRCDLRFHAHDGELRIAIAQAGQPEWRTTFALPNP